MSGNPKRAIGRLVIIALLASPAFLSAQNKASENTSLSDFTFKGSVLEVRTVDPRKEDLRLYWKSPSGELLHDFIGLQTLVQSQDETLLFAANAGMFQPDSSPVGLLILNGQQVAPLNLRDGTGNFCMKPNGVFALTDDHRAFVMESSTFVSFLPRVLWATQSGPLLVSEGVIHPDFNAGSASLKIRSGVGVRKDGTIVFLLSRTPINFYDFAIFFRDQMKCPNALFLDGDISAFHVPGQAEEPGRNSFGPMFGLVAPNKNEKPAKP